MKDFLTNFFGSRENHSNYQFHVEIFESVINRIKKAVISSDIEEGGKFLGKVDEKGENIFFVVQSYLDSGPRVSNSQTHLIPDGEHQESLYRLIEGYDPEINHIGTWHSHHSNGYPELSDGDINGYFHNINHKDYGLDWFFVLLVTEVKGQQFLAKYYAFHKGDRKYYSIPTDKVYTIKKTYEFESILHETENATFSYRTRNNTPVTQFSKDRLPTNTETHSLELEELLSEIRIEDKAWFGIKIPSARTIISRDNIISWKWTIPFEKELVEMIYSYPHIANKKLGHAILKAKYKNEIIGDFEIEMNNKRFLIIEKNIEEILRHLSQAKTSNSYY